MSIGGKSGDKMPEFTFITDTIHHVSSPNFYRHGAGRTEQEFADDLVQEFQDKVAELGGPDHVAGFFAEPIMGAGGVIMPPADHLQRIAAYCHEHGILYVSDEVGPCFLERPETLTDLPMVGDVRGSHLMVWVDFVADSDTGRRYDDGVDVGKWVANEAEARGSSCDRSATRTSCHRPWSSPRTRSTRWYRSSVKPFSRLAKGSKAPATTDPPEVGH